MIVAWAHVRKAIGNRLMATGYDLAMADHLADTWNGALSTLDAAAG